MIHDITIYGHHVFLLNDYLISQKNNEDLSITFNFSVTECCLELETHNFPTLTQSDYNVFTRYYQIWASRVSTILPNMGITCITPLSLSLSGTTAKPAQLTRPPAQLEPSQIRRG